MATLAEFRAQYPAYDGLSDRDLADRLYTKFYSGRLSRSEFDRRIGFAPGPADVMAPASGPVPAAGAVWPAVPAARLPTPATVNGAPVTAEVLPPRRGPMAGMTGGPAVPPGGPAPTMPIGRDADMLLPGLPGAPGALPDVGARRPHADDPAPPSATQADLPSIVRGLQEMEYAADPALQAYDLSATEMTPDRQARLDRLRRLGWASVLNQTDEGLFESVKAIYPDARLLRDDRNNPYVVVNGKAFYLNPPGTDAVDIARYGPSTLAGVLAGAGVGSAVPRLLPRMLAVGATEAGLSAGLDAGAQGLGSKQPVDLGRMGWAAGGGALGEVAGSAIAALIRRYGAGAARTVVNPTTGQPTVQFSPEAAAALRAADVDPSQISAEWLAQFQRDANNTLLPAEAGRVADLTTLPYPIPYSRGDITRLPADQMVEDLMSKGSYGEAAQRQFRGLREQQQDALAQNAYELTRRTGGPGAAGQPGIGAQLASETLNRLKAQMKAEVDALYDAARATSGGIDVQTGRGMAFDLGSGRDVGLFLPHAPRARATLEQFQDIVTRAGNGEIPVATLHGWRRALSTLERVQSDPTEIAAFAAIRQNFDDAMQRMVEGALIRGDDATVQAWANAVGGRRELGKLFEGGDLVERLTSTEYRSGRRVLVVPPDQAANAIFGLKGLGVGQMNLARDLARLRDVLRGPPMASEAAKAEGEAAWNALREEAARRLLLGASEGPYNMSTVARSFSGANLASAIDTAMSTNPSLMRVLFTADELAQLQQLKRAALAVTTSVRGGQNTSNSGPAIARMFQDMLSAPLRKIVGGLFGPNSILAQVPLGGVASNIVGTMRASSRIGGPVTTLPAPAGGLVGAIAGSPLFYPTDSLMGLITQSQGQPQGQ